MKDKDYDESEENVYSEDSREAYMESDGISPEEEGFMQGYDDADKEHKEEKEEKAVDEKEPEFSDDEEANDKLEEE